MNRDLGPGAFLWILAAAFFLWFGWIHPTLYAISALCVVALVIRIARARPAPRAPRVLESHEDLELLARMDRRARLKNKRAALRR